MQQEPGGRSGGPLAPRCVHRDSGAAPPVTAALPPPQVAAALLCINAASFAAPCRRLLPLPSCSLATLHHGGRRCRVRRGVRTVLCLHHCGQARIKHAVRQLCGDAPASRPTRHHLAPYLMSPPSGPSPSLPPACSIKTILLAPVSGVAVGCRAGTRTTRAALCSTAAFRPYFWVALLCLWFRATPCITTQAAPALASYTHAWLTCSPPFHMTGGGRAASGARHLHRLPKRVN